MKLIIKKLTTLNIYAKYKYIYIHNICIEITIIQLIYTIDKLLHGYIQIFR